MWCDDLLSNENQPKPMKSINFQKIFFWWLDAGGSPLVPYILSYATFHIYVHPPP